MVLLCRLGGKLLRQFTELRQQCCHPQIVRRDMWLGKSRLSMREILTRLVLKAFNEYDIAVRAEFTARILQAAVSCDPADAGALLLMAILPYPSPSTGRACSRSVCNAGATALCLLLTSFDTGELS